MSLSLYYCKTVPWRGSQLGPASSKVTQRCFKERSGIEASLLETQQRSAKTPRASVPNSTGCIDNAARANDFLSCHVFHNHQRENTKFRFLMFFFLFCFFSVLPEAHTAEVLADCMKSGPKSASYKRRPPFLARSSVPFCLR